MKPNLYENTASLYDVANESAPMAQDSDFYMETIPANASVLEVGCGTGRVSMALAKRGNLVTGIDLSQAMLNVFQTKLTENPDCAKRASILTKDMRSFDLRRTYDWIIFPFRVFQALKSDDDRMACMSSIRQHMTENSRAILTLFNPKRSILENWGAKNILDIERVDEALGRTVRRYQDQMWHDCGKQVIAARMRYEVCEHGMLTQTSIDEIELGYLYPDQCKALFAASHMAVVEAFGHYDWRALSDEEKAEQVYILRKVGVSGNV